ncbi:hypothetical protein J2785_005440 [Burkholderia ambifaria]|nr:hypothetical protein [Burkholderia ambifaria]MDR6502260.1 hypothetical protein [Burkholderia ambifaria]
MSTTADSYLPHYEKLQGEVSAPPSITGFPGMGVLMTWPDQGGRLHLAGQLKYGPVTEVDLPEAWRTLVSPSVLVAPQLETVFLAWTNERNQVCIASSKDGWRSTTVVAESASIGGPSLCHAGSRLFLAWTALTGRVSIAVLADNSTDWHRIETDVELNSRPSLSNDGDDLYIVGGGSADDQDGASFRVFLSGNMAQTFDEQKVMPFVYTSGPASLIKKNGYYHLVWATLEGELLYAKTKTLTEFEPTGYFIRTEGGSPGLADLGDRLAIAWATDIGSDGSPVASLGYVQGDPGVDPRLAARLVEASSIEAPNPCGPAQVYDPVTMQCELRLGCYGNCVIDSFSNVEKTPLFNPLTYALCVARCLARS